MRTSRRKQPKILENIKALRPWEFRATSMCPHKGRSTKRRPMIQAASAIHQRRRHRRKKENKIWFELYSMEAVINRDWIKPNYDLRYLFMHLAVHGFHHNIYQTEGYHSPNRNYHYKSCNSDCKRYHIIDWKCRLNHWPLMQNKINAHGAQYTTFLNLWLWIMWKRIEIALFPHSHNSFPPQYISSNFSNINLTCKIILLKVAFTYLIYNFQTQIWVK
jgi:hypothetical protein